ncbi:MAG: Universal stress protein [Pelotomaculum sp. PtaU1.Bin035]|nr:MAG: Universal stress protein [Pelotomaculum sp. PtaU1.Bin035]
MIKKILVAYDNGVKSQKALETAIEIAKGSKAEICLLVSVKMPQFISTVTSIDILKDLEEKNRQYFMDILKESEDKVGKEGIPVKSVILNESPGEAIVSYANKEKFDLIVMGSANRGTVERVLLGLGSVSNYVLHHAKCSILIIKN